jgi:hypothetical protein
MRFAAALRRRAARGAGCTPHSAPLEYSAPLVLCHTLFFGLRILGWLAFCEAKPGNPRAALLGKPAVAPKIYSCDAALE